VTGTLNPYLRRVACKTCPFRRGMVGVLRPERAQEIAQGLLDGGSFTCHKTTVPDPDTDEEMVPGPHAQECAGALATMENAGQANQLTRIAERLGMRDPGALDVDRSEVFGSLAEWVAAHREPDAEELEHCGVVGPECEDPPGYWTGSGPSESLDEATCDPEHSCQFCGHVMCESCTSPEDETACVLCAEDDA